jgi:peroxiredoxin
LQQVASALKEHGATIVAITPQLAEASRSLIEKQRISFDLLSDPGNAYAAKLGLRFALSDDLKGVYLSFGNDLAVRNGEGSWTLPMPGRLPPRTAEDGRRRQGSRVRRCIVRE